MDHSGQKTRANATDEPAAQSGNALRDRATGNATEGSSGVAQAATGPGGGGNTPKDPPGGYDEEEY